MASTERVLATVFMSVMLPALTTVGLLKFTGVLDRPEVRFATADYTALLESVPVGASREEMERIVEAFNERVNTVAEAGYVVIDKAAYLAGPGVPEIPIDLPVVEQVASTLEKRRDEEAEPKPSDSPTEGDEPSISLLSDAYTSELLR